MVAKHLVQVYKVLVQVISCAFLGTVFAHDDGLSSVNDGHLHRRINTLLLENWPFRRLVVSNLPDQFGRRERMLSLLRQGRAWHSPGFQVLQQASPAYNLLSVDRSQRKSQVILSLSPETRFYPNVV